MSRQLISKMIVQLYEKNYSAANDSLKNILEAKISDKAIKMAKAKNGTKKNKAEDKPKDKKNIKKGSQNNK